MTDPPSEDAAPTLRDRAVRGGVWLLARQAVTNLLRIVELAVVARNVAPAAFGLVALAGVLLQFLTLVADGGLGTYVIYYVGDDWREEARAAFWMNLAITCVQVGLCLLVAPLVGTAFHQPRLFPVFLALLAIFFIRQAGEIQDAVLRRQLRYRAVAVRDIVVLASSSGLAVVLAVRGWGVWSLVVPELVLAPIGVAIATWNARWLPGRRPLRGRWRRMFRYSKHLMGAYILQITINDGDTLVVGRFLGDRALGFYNLAWQLSNYVGRTVGSVVSDISLPTLADIRRRTNEVGPAYLQLVRLLAALGQPLLGLLFVFAPQVVDLLYGPRYSPVATILRILIVFTAVRVFTSPAGTAFNVTGRTDLALKVNLATAPVYLVAIVTGTHWGAVGVAVAVGGVRTVGALGVFAVSLRLVGLDLVASARTIARTTILAAGACGAAAAIAALLPAAPTAVVLAVASTCGLALYAALLRAFHPAAWRDVAGLVASGLGRSGRPRTLAQPSDVRAPVTMEDGS